MMKKTIIILLLTFSVVSVLIVSHSSAYSLGFNPSSQTVGIGNPFDLPLSIDGLSDISLGAYDISIFYDPTVLSFNSVAFGDPISGDQLDLLGVGIPITTTTSDTGTVNLFELSFNTIEELNTLQLDRFTLAVLNLTAITQGTTSVNISDYFLSDAEGRPIVASLSNAAITVTPAAVPEPSTALLLASGLVGVVCMMRRRR